MKKDTLIDILSAKTGETKKTVGTMLDKLAEAAKETVSLGSEFSIPGVVKLKVGARKAREGRNPATGETVQIPARTVVTASPAKALKDAVAE